MAAADSLEERSARLARLIEKQMGVRGRGLDAKVRRAGRRLPRWVHRSAMQIVEAERMAAHPKLRKLVSTPGLDQAFRSCEAWLKSHNRAALRRSFWLNVLASTAFNVIVVAVLFGVTLKLTGLV